MKTELEIKAIFEDDSLDTDVAHWASVQAIAMEDFQICQSVKISGIDYEKSMAIVLDSDNEDDFFTVGIIQVLLARGEEVSFIVKKYVAQHILSVRAYRLDRNKGMCLVGFNQLKDYYPLSVYEVQGDFYVTLKHSILCSV